MLFDEDKNQIPFLEELRLIREIIDELQEETPYFQFKLILTGLKIVGKTHIQKMLDNIEQGVDDKDKRLAELIAGFDMVNEEDYTPEIGDFAEQILTSKQEVNIITQEKPTEEKEPMPTFFHAGETHDRNCKNLQDAISLGNCKRIGHGFQLMLFPYL